MNAPTVEQRVQVLLEEFAAHDTWMERYKHLVAMGDDIPRVTESEKSEENYIPGCQYDVWIDVVYDPERDAVTVRADSDARITRGLAALLVRVLDGQPPRAVARADFGFLEEIGLRKHLSPHRANGLRALIHHTKARARRYVDGAGDEGRT